MAGPFQEKRERAPVSTRAIEVASTDWDTAVLSSARPVLVDFWAAWCPPCRRVAPAVESLAASLDGLCTVAKLDVDASPDVAARYGVMSIPTFVVFVGGREVARARGAMAEAELRRLVEAHLSPREADARSAG
jgi:thioredoxin 1